LEELAWLRIYASDQLLQIIDNVSPQSIKWTTKLYKKRDESKYLQYSHKCIHTI